MTASAENKQIIQATRHWLEQFVIKHNFCPFAAKPFREKRIRYASYSVSTEEELVDRLVEEIILLKDVDPAEIETSIVIAPSILADFLDYNQFLNVVDAIIAELHVDGIIQVASFHPAYQFVDLAADDVRNYTNRSPYPMFHLIREDSIEQARNMLDTEAIPQRNMALLLELGIDTINKKG